MTNLKLVTTETFRNVLCDFYRIVEKYRPDNRLVFWI